MPKLLSGYIVLDTGFSIGVPSGSNLYCIVGYYKGDEWSHVHFMHLSWLSAKERLSDIIIVCGNHICS